MAVQYSYSLCITYPGGIIQSLDVRPGIITLGRDEDNTQKLADGRVSRHHARIECALDNTCIITDLGSANGTAINDAKIKPGVAAHLAVGAKVLIGPFTLTLQQVSLAAPPAPPAAPPAVVLNGEGADFSLPGLDHQSRLLLSYLPGIYHTDFMSRFLALFESILLPILWTVDNFDLYLNLRTAPSAFLSWLASWYEITFDATWNDEQRRALLAEAGHLYARRGTRWALSRVLEIYTGQMPTIVDDAADQSPFTFEVVLHVGEEANRRICIESIINAHKPAHTSCSLRLEPRVPA
jgi:phage tail-like protein